MRAESRLSARALGIPRLSLLYSRFAEFQMGPPRRIASFIFLSLWLACTSCNESTTEPAEPAKALPVVTPVTAEDGRREVYELWKASEQISPLLPGSTSRLDSATRRVATETLNSKSFVQYESRQRRNFREFRDGIVRCSDSRAAACSVENMGRFSPCSRTGNWTRLLRSS